MSSLIGPWGIVILVVILFLVYGPKRLSTIGRSMGKGKREFMDSMSADGKNNRPAELPPAAPSEQSESTSPVSEHDSD